MMGSIIVIKYILILAFLLRTVHYLSLSISMSHNFQLYSAVSAECYPILIKRCYEYKDSPRPSQIHSFEKSECVLRLGILQQSFLDYRPRLLNSPLVHFISIISTLFCTNST
jgi:hypothetical protein